MDTNDTNTELNSPAQRGGRTHPSVNQPRSGLNYYVVPNMGVTSYAPSGTSLARRYPH